MTLHGALSILTTVTPGREEELASLLVQIDKDPVANTLLPFGEIKSVHFARLLLLPAGPDVKGNPLPCRLVLTTNYDQPLANHLRELKQYGGPGLWKVFAFCEGFPGGAYDEKVLSRFLETHSIPANTFYVGVGNRSVTQIRQENELREAIELFLDRNREHFRGKDAGEIREEIRYFVAANPDLVWASEPAPASTPSYTFSRSLRLLGVILLFLLLSPLLLPVVIIWWGIILFQELTEKEVIDHVGKEHLKSLLDRERGIVQNQFSAFGNVKGGWFRYETMMLLLKLTDFLAPYIFSKGALSGIPTVHFARWLIISEGRQLLFLSNYDGNSEGYLRDFINIAAKQLTLLFSHTVGYPRTYLMIFGGAKDANGFMAWARQNQLITNVWYSANPTISVKNIFQNSEIRSGLYGTMSDEQARKWLGLF